MLMKLCTCCEKEKEATPEKFRCKKDGLTSWCKECLKKKGVKSKRTIRKLELEEKGLKECSDCKDVLPATTIHFSRNKNSKDGLCHRCKECSNINSKKWREENKEKVKEREKKYWEIHSERLRKLNKTWKEENKEEIAKKYPAWYKKEKIRRKEPVPYDMYASRLEWCEAVKRNEENPDLLEVTCTKCKIWFMPELQNVRHRINAINGNGSGENRFYCSEECKNTCEIFGKHVNTLMRDDAIKAGRIPWYRLDRELQRELRAMVLERDNYTCQECGSTDNLECHHIKSVVTEPIESADVDNCITLCEICHRKKPRPSKVCY